MQVTKLPLSFKTDKIFSILWNTVASLLIVAWFCLLFSGSATNSQNSAYSPQDTIPKKIKMYSVQYDLNTWIRKMDTLNAVHGVVGKSLTVDQAEQLKNMFSSVLSDMIRQINQQQVTDTIKQKNK